VTVANGVLTKVGSGGKVCVYTHAATDLVIDVTGFFGLAPNQPESNVTVLEQREATITSGGPGDGAATITTTDSSLKTGDLVVATETSGQPYYGRVTAVTGQSVATEEVALAAVIPVMDLQMQVDTANGSSQVRQGAAAVSDLEVVSSPTLESGLIKNKRASCGAASEASISAGYEVDAGNFVFDVSLNRWKTGLGYARIGYNPLVRAEVSVSASTSVTCNVNAFLGSSNLPTIRFTVYGVPVWITQQLDYSLQFSIEAGGGASAQFAAGASAWVGVEYNDGRWSRQASINAYANRTASTGGHFNVKWASPVVRYGARLYGIAGLDATLFPRLELTYTPSQLKYLALKALVDVEIGAEFELDLKVTNLKYAHTFARATLWGPQEVWRHRILRHPQRLHRRLQHHRQPPLRPLLRRSVIEARSFGGRAGILITSTTKDDGSGSRTRRRSIARWGAGSKL
jgi:hypothetical protein